MNEQTRNELKVLKKTIAEIKTLRLVLLNVKYDVDALKDKVDAIVRGMTKLPEKDGSKLKECKQ